MLSQVKPLTRQIVNEMQVITGACELGDLDASLRSVGRCYVHLQLLRNAITREVKPEISPAGSRQWIVKPN